MTWLMGIIVVIMLAYFSVPLWVWTLIAFFVLSFISFMTAPITFALSLCWMVFIVIALLFNIKPLRQQLFSRWVLTFVRRSLPPISDTEKEAIAAGNTWWEAQLFQGKPQWKAIQAFKLATLTEREQAFIDNQVNQLCHLIDTWKQSNDHKHSEQVWDYIKKERFFSMLIPQSYGGLEFSAYAQSTIVSKIATRDMSTAVTVMVPNSLGPSELLLHYGTPEQKAYYLPRLASSQEIPCFGLTAPEAGSDAGGMPDKGIVAYGDFEGKRVLGLRLTFSKRYITLAPVATVLGLAFKCYDPEGLLGAGVNRGITLCLIPATHKGIQVGDYHLPIGSSFPNGTMKGTDVFIPIDWVIGGQEQVGRGWHMLMECLAAGRGISLPALATASAKLAFRTTGAYASIRKQFNVPIGLFEGIQADLARIAGFTYILESMRVVTASAITEGVKPSVVSAIAKYHMTELARKAMNHAMDIHAGRAVIDGPSNYLANAYTMLPVSITVEGANILTRNLIIFGQGAIRCHPYILNEMMAAQDETSLSTFDKYLMKHLGYTISNKVRTLVESFTAGKLILGLPKGDCRPYCRQISRMSTAFAFVSDVTLIWLGGNLKRMESISARLGDILSYLYMATTVMKYYESTTRSENEKWMMNWSMDYCFYQMQKAWNGLFNNFPVPGLGLCLKWMVFPYGDAYSYPRDALSQKVAHLMMEPGALRDKLSAYMYHGDESTAVGELEATFTLLAKTQQPLAKFAKAQKEKGCSPMMNWLEKLEWAREQQRLDQDEYELLKHYYEHYLTAIAVDEFHA